MTSPEPETSGQDVVSDEAVAAAVADLRRVAIECVCGTDDGDTGTCTCPSIFEHATYGYEVVEIHGLVEDIARWVLTAAAPHTQAQWAAAKAYEIRAELVCCDIYDRDAYTNRAGQTHAICFWGEAAARIVEGGISEHEQRQMDAVDDEVVPQLDTIRPADLAVLEATGRAVFRDVSVKLEPEETDEERIRADERARVLGEVQEALRDSERFLAWVRGRQVLIVGRNRELIADYLSDVLGTGGDAPEPADAPARIDADGSAGSGAVVGVSGASGAAQGDAIELGRRAAEIAEAIERGAWPVTVMCGMPDESEDQ